MQAYLLSISVDLVKPQGLPVRMDPAGGNSRCSYRLGNISEEDNVVGSLEEGDAGEPH